MEERINAIANSLVESIAYKPNEYDLGIAKDALTMIATEQKAIDIDKACGAFCLTTCKGFQDTHRCYLDDKCPQYWAFRKMIE